MQVSVETTSGLERRMTVGIPADRIESEVNKRLQQTASRAKVDGFRPGKVPMSVIRKRFGGSARQEVMGEVIQSSFYEAIMQEKLNPAGAPSVEPKELDEGKDFEYVATFEVYPEITLGDFGDIKVERIESEVRDEDLENMLEILRKQNTQFETVERAAENGDQLKVDFVGRVDGEPFQGGTANNTEIVLGSGRMIPGFEDGLVGAKAGDTVTLEVTFPEEYQNLELAGKPAEFDVVVHAVAAPALPELNDEFFAKFGVEEGGIDAFRSEVRKNMDRELRQAIKTKVKTQVMDGLLATNSVDVPKALVSSEIDRLRQQAVQQFGGANISPEQLPAELFEEQAKRRVSLGLVVSEVVKQNDIKPENDRVRAMVEELASAYQEPEQVVNWYYQNEQQLAEIQSVVLEEQVVDTVLQKAQVATKQVPYEDAVKPAQSAKDLEADEAEAGADE
ncbi:trigger factor [uncultured Halopseudomonas sp.]|uniref:trigger factor n=1 Tax=uncultured Halopseudomonas sp. TaxID=2901193 RepID=UPI0030EB6D99|tara:strand:+ start:84843 stop:86189 length:1347 start_codon:yes stop_codon:yes gene_type:complete